MRTGACRPSGGGTGTACKPYIPGGYGTSDQVAVEGVKVVTDAATEEKPVEVVVPTDAAAEGEPAASAPQYVNIQVDTTKGEVGLYARFEFLPAEDNDL